MATPELLHITIDIAGRNYPLKVTADDKVKVEALVANVNATLKQLMEKYDGRDMQDYMAMYILIELNKQSGATTNEISHQQFDNINILLDKLIAI